MARYLRNWELQREINVGLNVAESWTTRWPWPAAS